MPILTEIPIVSSKPCEIKPACFGNPSNTCYYCYFNSTEISPGIKNFKLEAKQWNKMTAVNISLAEW